MLDEDVFIPDNIEYEFIINYEVNSSLTNKKPELYLGDVEINLTQGGVMEKEVPFHLRLKMLFLITHISKLLW